MDDLNTVNNMVLANSSGTKKGSTLYTKWRREKIGELEKLNTEETVFDRLKGLGEEANTVFTKLKRFSGR